VPESAPRGIVPRSIKETDIFENEPYIFGKEPYILEKEFFVFIN